jgi:hypothetical protein
LITFKIFGLDLGWEAEAIDKYRRTTHLEFQKNPLLEHWNETIIGIARSEGAAEGAAHFLIVVMNC